jgi:hypothetical protein
VNCNVSEPLLSFFVYRNSHVINPGMSNSCINQCNSQPESAVRALMLSCFTGIFVIKIRRVAVGELCAGSFAEKCSSSTFLLHFNLLSSMVHIFNAISPPIG